MRRQRYSFVYLTRLLLRCCSCNKVNDRCKHLTAVVCWNKYAKNWFSCRCNKCLLFAECSLCINTYTSAIKTKNGLVHIVFPIPVSWREIFENRMFQIKREPDLSLLFTVWQHKFILESLQKVLLLSYCLLKKN